jgi:hypothetical protein
MPNKVYTVVEELIIFTSGDAGDLTFNLNNLAFAAGRYSDRHDRGTGSKPSRARIWGKFNLAATTPTIGEQIEVYVIEWSSHGTPIADGDLGTTDAALTSDQRKNLGAPALIVIVDSTNEALNFVGNAIVEIPGRYVSVAVWNATTDNFQAAADVSQVSIEWLPDEIQ